jgi:Icc protein
VSGHAQTGNYYFERNEARSRYPQSASARAAMSTARVPVVAIAGHVHWNTVTCVDGVHHLTQQSLTESFTTQGEPAAAWGLLELGDTVRWTVFGADPFESKLTPRKTRWTPPVPEFSQLQVPSS